jgi:transcriptional regulator with XRE-family HTH domain
MALYNLFSLKNLSVVMILDIVKIRIKLGYTQKQVADLCGIKQGSYSRIENGIKKPGVQLAKKLGDLFDLDWTSFFD